MLLETLKILVNSLGWSIILPFYKNTVGSFNRFKAIIVWLLDLLDSILYYHGPINLILQAQAQAQTSFNLSPISVLMSSIWQLEERNWENLTRWEKFIKVGSTTLLKTDSTNLKGWLISTTTTIMSTYREQIGRLFCSLSKLEPTFHSTSSKSPTIWY